jgi:hypothetical protein
VAGEVGDGVPKAAHVPLGPPEGAAVPAMASRTSGSQAALATPATLWAPLMAARRRVMMVTLSGARSSPV